MIKKRKIAMNLDEYGICQNQARLYEYVAHKGVDIEWFSENYLRSSFCKRAFDTIYSRFQTADEQECLDFIWPELGSIKYMERDMMFDPDIAYWIGFTYRQLYIETNISSSELVEKIDFATMFRYYPGLHTIDEEMATDIICENKGFEKLEKFQIDKEDNDI